MSITPETLERLAYMANLHIEEVGPPPQTAGQPHTLRIAPPRLLGVASRNA